MVKSNCDDERRKGRRFQVGWDVAVRGTDPTGRGFDESGTLGNLSSCGALLYLPREVSVGSRIELRIKVPFKKNNLMKYAAEVVRVKNQNVNVGIAVKFDAARPVFVER